MLSSGVLAPDSRFIGTATRMKSSPSCGIERATVAEEDADRRGEEEVDHHAAHEQRNRAGDRDVEQGAARRW